MAVALLVVAVALLVATRSGQERSSSAATATAPAPAPATALRSRPDLRPPAIDLYTRSEAVAPGLMLVAPKKVFGAEAIPNEQQGAMLVDDHGRVRWFLPMPGDEEAFDFRVQEMGGRPVLTWWQGRAVRGTGQGVGVVMGSDYQPVARVEPGGGAIADIHEFLLTDRGTALMLIYEHGVERNLRAIGGKQRTKVVDGVIQEVDLKSGKVLLEWSALDHIDPSESREPLDKRYLGSWDYVHFNSIDVDTDGNLLVSARHSWAVYKIDRETGEVIWRLGGKRSDFQLEEELRFSWQHDARAEGPGRIRLFDNAAASKPVRPASRVLRLDLDAEAGRASLVSQIEHPRKLSAGTQANAQLLPGGRTFVGWGSQGHFSEFDEDGRLLFDARVQRGYDSYRAYRSEWRGSPRGEPALAVERTGDDTTAYVSWNGSTEVQSWQVLTGSSPDNLRSSGEPVAWAGLETALRLQGQSEYVAVRALDDDGETLGQARPRRMPAA